MIFRFSSRLMAKVQLLNHCETLRVPWGNQWHSGLKAHVGVDADSGLVHSVIGTAPNINDATLGHGLHHRKEKSCLLTLGIRAP